MPDPSDRSDAAATAVVVPARSMIEVVDLVKHFRVGRQTVAALAGVSLAVSPGEIHGVVGRSGAGKSTLIRCLSLLERPSSGAVVVDGDDVTALSRRQLRAARRRIGMVFQRDNLLDSRTAAANVRYPLEVAGLARQEQRRRAGELLELVGLGDRGDSYPAQLSGGQRQRVGIARALAADPAVLLCDEPTSALDPATTEQILDLIASLRRQLGITVLLITHEMAAVRRICDSVTLLEGGAVVAQGPLAAVAAAPAGRLARELVPTAAAVAGAGQAVLEIAYGSPTLSTVDALDAVVAVADHAVVVAATVETLQGEQIGRLRLVVDQSRRNDIAAHFQSRGLTVLGRDEAARGAEPVLQEVVA